MFAKRKNEELSYPKNQKMCDPILATHYSQSSRENATPSNGTSPLASYKEVTPPPPPPAPVIVSLAFGSNHNNFPRLEGWGSIWKKRNLTHHHLRHTNII